METCNGLLTAICSFERWGDFARELNEDGHYFMI